MFSRPNITLIGAGQLGSRYLQGLAGIKRHLSITVVDPSDKSLGIAIERLAEVGPSPHSFQFLNSISESKDPVDLCIVTTPAHCRADVVATITSQYEVNAWILEKVLGQSTQHVNQIVRLLKSNLSVWINTPMRIMAWHNEIKKQMSSICGTLSPLQVRVSGGNWGLACNAIHYIDLVSWWSGARVEAVNAQGLENWRASKRMGYQEVFGTLIVTFHDATVLELTCSQVDAPPRIEVETTHGLWTIDEEAGVANGPSGQQIYGQPSFQSILTAPLVEQILDTGQSKLPSLAESAAQHRPFLDALLQHWNQSHARQDLAVPIT